MQLIDLVLTPFSTLLDDIYAKPTKINERSESFNEKQLIMQLTKESENISLGKEIEESFNYRRESFNENYLRDVRDEGRFKSANEVTSGDAGSPFVSMPTIPAVYLAENGDSQPLEKVIIIILFILLLLFYYIIIWSMEKEINLLVL